MKSKKGEPAMAIFKVTVSVTDERHPNEPAEVNLFKIEGAHHNSTAKTIAEHIQTACCDLPQAKEFFRHPQPWPHGGHHPEALR